jgi:arylsulfatase A-like enzyme
MADGKSLIPLMTGNKEEINDYIYAGTFQFRNEDIRHFSTGINEVDVIRNKEWKLIKEATIDYNQDAATKVEYELYNIKEDPKEQKNLLKEQLSIVNDLKKKLQDWILETKN